MKALQRRLLVTCKSGAMASTMVTVVGRSCYAFGETEIKRHHFFGQTLGSTSLSRTMSVPPSRNSRTGHTGNMSAQSSGYGPAGTNRREKQYELKRQRFLERQRRKKAWGKPSSPAPILYEDFAPLPGNAAPLTARNTASAAATHLSPTNALSQFVSSHSGHSGQPGHSGRGTQFSQQTATNPSSRSATNHSRQFLSTAQLFERYGGAQPQSQESAQNVYVHQPPPYTPGNDLGTIAEHPPQSSHQRTQTQSYSANVLGNAHAPNAPGALGVGPHQQRYLDSRGIPNNSHYSHHAPQSAYTQHAGNTPYNPGSAATAQQPGVGSFRRDGNVHSAPAAYAQGAWRNGGTGYGTVSAQQPQQYYSQQQQQHQTQQQQQWQQQSGTGASQHSAPHNTQSQRPRYQATAPVVSSRKVSVVPLAPPGGFSQFKLM